ncbi:restriction endonuclease subunit S [Bacteroides thetaiotaomicron]|uniref:restriction endonuclease subunit S n=1 Tax=Bacteroides thetaiotaomicron TaxID=818 RepID=UPI0039C34747
MPFEVPSSWVWTNIEELFFVTKLAGFEYTDYLTKDAISSNNEIPIVRAQNVRMGHFVENTNEAISEALSQLLERSALTKECLLMTFIGAGIGDTCIFPALKRCHLAPNVAKIEPYSGKIDLRYALYYLMSDLGQLGVRGISKSTAQPSLSMATIRSLDVALPPLAEQRRIVTEIEKWFSLIDQIEQGKADLQTTIKQTKSKILDLAIHGKLVPQDPNDEPAMELLKRINPDFAPCDNGHYPNGWQQTILGELFYHNTGKALNSSNKEGVMRNYLTTSNVYWNKFDFTVIKQMPFKESELDKCTVTKGDLLVCEGGDIGRSAIWNYDYDICIQNHIHRLRPKIDLCVLFYYYALAYLKENNLIGGKGIGLLGLSSNALHKIELPLPPLTEQQRIVQKIEELFSVLDNIQKALEV